jgi:nitroreductase
VNRLDLSADDVLTTTRAVRRRLDLERPVEREVIEQCIDIALQAPTGSNRQEWNWVVVTDAAKRRKLADLYGERFDQFVQTVSVPYDADDIRSLRNPKIFESALYLREHLHEVPVHVIPCATGRPPTVALAPQAGWWGSIMPAVWSFMLALRSRGLGSSLTTLHLLKEDEAADLLGIPAGEVTQVGLIPVAYTIGTEFRPASRRPCADVVHWDSW